MYFPAHPLGTLALPVYPAEALAAHAGRTKIVLQITVGTDGRVTQITDALASVPFLGPFSPQFRAAAEAAVAQWRFEPAERQHLDPYDVNGTKVWEITRSEKVETVTQVAFTFTESGKVESSRQ